MIPMKMTGTKRMMGNGSAVRLREGGLTMSETKTNVVYAVLLYPPRGAPRVVELPASIAEFIAEYDLCVTFSVRADADDELEKFLNANPEYRRWRDGRIQPGQ